MAHLDKRFHNQTSELFWVVFVRKENRRKECNFDRWISSINSMMFIPKLMRIPWHWYSDYMSFTNVYQIEIKGIYFFVIDVVISIYELIYFLILFWRTVRYEMKRPQWVLCNCSKKALNDVMITDTCKNIVNIQWDRLQKYLAHVLHLGTNMKPN